MNKIISSNQRDSEEDIRNDDVSKRLLRVEILSAMNMIMLSIVSVWITRYVNQTSTQIHQELFSISKHKIMEYATTNHDPSFNLFMQMDQKSPDTRDRAIKESGIGEDMKSKNLISVPKADNNDELKVNVQNLPHISNNNYSKPNSILDPNGTESHQSNTFHKRSLQESRCDSRPLLSPSNVFNNFEYDEKIAKILDMIFSITSSEDVHDPSTAQYKAACWVIYEDMFESSGFSRIDMERYIFAIFLYSMMKDAVLGPFRTCDFDRNIMNCTNEGYISDIRYNDHQHSNDFKATIPTELAYLQFLENLEISTSQLMGTIPSQLGRLKNLKSLLLGGNHLIGTVPTEIGRLVKLQSLNLGDNNLSGDVPTEFGNFIELRGLYLDRNNLVRSIPSEIYFCTKLKELWLFANRFSGTISTHIGMLANLETIYLGKNALTGPIPSEIGNILDLQWLHIDNNKLNGPIPREIGNINFIKRLWLNTNGLSGTLPNVFGNFTQLFSLSLSNNKLSGPVPHSLWDLPTLDSLFLQVNFLTGSVPDAHCQKEGLISDFDLSPWFVNQPKIECDCCNKAYCNFWETTVTKTHMPCTRVLKFTYKTEYHLTDVLTGVDLSSTIGEVTNDASLCLSPSGCYKINYFDANSNRIENVLGYSIESNDLTTGLQCDGVEVCGYVFDQNDPKRVGLNHLLQLVDFDIFSLNDTTTPRNRALCWIMTEDELFHEFSECDGTLLQRYSLVLFLFNSFELSTNFTKLATQHTCEWPYVQCRRNEKFVSHVNISNTLLHGTLISEIGFLSNLESLDLSNNTLEGTLDPSIFAYLPFLDKIDIGMNNFNGKIPRELFEAPKLREITLSHNKFHGELPSDVEYPKNLEHIEVGDNLLHGTIPYGLVLCTKMKIIDLSRNNFNGEIVSNIGELENLQIVKLQENFFTGSIPMALFDSKRIQVLQLQTNGLTGTIPTQIATLLNISSIILNHNQLKGTIPSELNVLKNLEMLHLHHNKLTGVAPIMNFTNTTSTMRFIADCGRPFYLLSDQLMCESCSMCCNSDGKCQESKNFNIYTAIFLIIGFPFIIIFCEFAINITFNREQNITLPPLTYDSVYCFLFTKNVIARVIFLITLAIQVWLFSIFLEASNLRSPNTDWQFTIQCPDNSVTCTNERSLNPSGWIVFAIVTVTYLGKDIFKSCRLLQQAVVVRDLQLFFSGFFLFSLTGVALYASIMYNIALAETNTDLIMNAVILLFINDLDEQVLSILNIIASDWTDKQIEEVQEVMALKEKAPSPPEPEQSDLSP